VDKRVDDHRRPALGAVERELQVVDGLDPRMANLLELLPRELSLERMHQPYRRLTGGVRDDVQLDGWLRHPREATAG
jgi:hypothetical protein